MEPSCRIHSLVNLLRSANHDERLNRRLLRDYKAPCKAYSHIASGFRGEVHYKDDSHTCFSRSMPINLIKIFGLHIIYGQRFQQPLIIWCLRRGHVSGRIGRLLWFTPVLIYYFDWLARTLRSMQRRAGLRRVKMFQVSCTPFLAFK
jgi:hypothetical protein